MIPRFQFQASSPLARRRHTTACCSGYMHGISDGVGRSVKAMYAPYES